MTLLIDGCEIRPLYDNLNVDRDVDNKSKVGKFLSFKVDVIANRDGQKLRGYLLDLFRDTQFSKQILSISDKKHEKSDYSKLRLTVTLNYFERSFALDSRGYAHRLLSIYEAKTQLKDEKGDVILDEVFRSSTTYNIAHAQGEMLLSLYGKSNTILLKDLAYKIVEGIRIVLEKKNEIGEK